MEAERPVPPVREGSSSRHGSSSFVSRRRRFLEEKQQETPSKNNEVTDKEADSQNSSIGSKNLNLSSNEVDENCASNDLTDEENTVSDNVSVKFYVHQSPRTDNAEDRDKILERALSRVRNKLDKNASKYHHSTNVEIDSNAADNERTDINCEDAKALKSVEEACCKTIKVIDQEILKSSLESLEQGVEIEKYELESVEKNQVEQQFNKQQEGLENLVSGLQRGGNSSVLVNTRRTVRDTIDNLVQHSVERPTSASPNRARVSGSQSFRIVRGKAVHTRTRKEREVSPQIRASSAGNPISFEQKSATYGSNSDLKLSLKGLTDSDDDCDEIGEKFGVSGNSSPRKGLLASTKSSDAKTAIPKRSIIRNKIYADRAGSADRTRPLIKQSLNLKTFSSESLDGQKDKEVPTISTLKRTSSGRKLPGVPGEPVKRPVKKSDSEDSFLSIRKDGGTEYVALDLNKFVSITESFSAPEMQAEAAKSVDKKAMSRTLPGDSSMASKAGQGDKDKVGKPPLERKSSRGVISATKQPSPKGSPRKLVQASPRGSASPRVSNSPRVCNSPRVSNSPRTKPASPSPRISQTSRTSQPSPRDSATKPRLLERKGSTDKIRPQVLVDKHSVKSKGNETIPSKPALNGHEQEPKLRRRTSSGSLVSPRPSSPLKARHINSVAVDGSLQATQIVEEPAKPRFTRQDSCQQMDLQQIIAMFQVEQDCSSLDESEARSETEIQSEKTWTDAERVWLVHKGGFASASQLKGEGYGLPEGRVKIRLDHGGEILDVDEDDVEKANAPQLDRAEDLCLLRYLNESSSLHTLRQRYGGNLIHTYAGPSLIIVNPMQPLQIYSEKVIQMFKGCKQEDMPPHIFATAQIAYREMLNTRQDQSIVMMGRSGSGKTYNVHHVLHYLAMSAGSVNNILSVDKLNAMTELLEAFGNSRTILNTSASRFSQMTTLDFDHNGQVVSASVQVLMFEKTRVVRRPEGEPTFNVFYQLLAGVDTKLRSELQLNNLNDPNLFMTPLQKADDKQRAIQYWGKIQNAMSTIGMSEEEVKCICCVLAAVYHLGVAGAVKGNNNKGQFSRPAGAQRAASLLGISVEELARNIFASSGTATLTRNASVVRGSPADKLAEAHTTAMEALEGFAVGLYSDVFNAIVSMINRSLSSNYRSLASITVVDTPGFQNPATCGRQAGASFEDLCNNYTQEKLQLLFHDLVFTTPQDRYSQENVECDFEFVTTSPAAMVSLIDKPSQQSLVRTSTPETREAEKKGLLWILDEEAIFPGATEDSFMDRFFSYHGEHKVKRDSLLRKASSLGNTFILNHFQGTNPVQYNASGWLKVCRENPITKVATQVLQDSKKANIKELFNSVKAPVGGMVSGSIVGMEGSTSLRRVGSMRRTFISGTAGLKKRSLCLQVKFQVDTIIETLRKTKCHFIHCLLPQANAGLCELRSPETAPDKPDDILINVPLLRGQFRGNEILESVRIYRQGFPDHITFGEFIQKFEGLIPPNVRPTPDMGEKTSVIQILENLDIDKLNYRIGLSKVFFRAGALNRLESSRDDRVTGRITAFQAYCRGVVARKRLAKLRVQHVAISCIQKNVRKFYQIRDWDWWKLYLKVKPLLNVHRTEEELHDREAEVSQVMKTEIQKAKSRKTKLGKVEKKKTMKDKES